MVIAALILFAMFFVAGCGAIMVVWAIVSLVREQSREKHGAYERYVPVYGSREPD